MVYVAPVRNHYISFLYFPSRDNRTQIEYRYSGEPKHYRRIVDRIWTWKINKASSNYEAETEAATITQKGLKTFFIWKIKEQKHA